MFSREHRTTEYYDNRALLRTEAQIPSHSHCHHSFLSAYHALFQMTRVSYTGCHPTDIHFRFTLFSFVTTHEFYENIVTGDNSFMSYLLSFMNTLNSSCELVQFLQLYSVSSMISAICYIKSLPMSINHCLRSSCYPCSMMLSLKIKHPSSCCHGKQILQLKLLNWCNLVSPNSHLELYGTK